MSTSSILRASRRTSLKPLNSPKSILKRSGSLSLTPLLLALPFSSCPTIKSPSSPFPKSPSSPHVHFPPTPSLSSTFATHSSATYDRAPIQVVHNPLELPPRGEMAYDAPFADSLSHGVVPVDIPATTFDPPMLDSEVPLSPSAAGLMSPPPVFHRFVRFATLPPHSPLPSSNGYASAKNTPVSVSSPYPRSPYPSAPSPPLTPVEDKENVPVANTQPKKKPRRIVAWKGHGELKLADLFAAPSVASPLRQSHFSTNAAATTPAPQLLDITSPSHASRPPPLDLSPGSGSESDCSNPSSQLSKAFWRSVSLVDLHDEDAAASAWAYPPSAVEFQEFLTQQEDGNHDNEMTRTIPRLSLMSPVPLSAAPLSAVPDLVMGRKPEMLWSPGLPRKKLSLLDVPESVSSDSEGDGGFQDGARPNYDNYMKGYPSAVDGDVVDLTSILSPGAQREVEFKMNPPPRSTVAAPSPNDPFAAFPSFSAVLHLHGVTDQGREDGHGGYALSARQCEGVHPKVRTVGQEVGQGMDVGLD